MPWHQRRSREAELDQVRRRALVAAAEVVGHAHGIAAAPDEGRLDEVVAEDQPAERRLAGSSGSPPHAAKARVRMIALWPQ